MGKLMPKLASPAVFVALTLLAAIAGPAALLLKDDLGLPLAMTIVLLAVGLMAASGMAMGLIYRREQAMAQLLARTVDESPKGRFIAADDGRVIYANESYRRTMGLDDRAPVRNLRELFPGREEALAAIDLVEREARAGGLPRVEIIVPDGRGGERCLAVAARYPAMAEGGVLWFVSDETAEYQMRRKMELAERRVADFVEKAPVGFYAADGEGYPTYVNATLAAWIGADPADLVEEGATIADLIVGAAIDAGKIRENGAAANAELRLTRDGRLLSRDGTMRPVRITQSVTLDGNGNIAAVHAVVRDMTEERQLESALKKAEKHFRRFFEHAPIGILWLERSGRIAEANRAFRKIAGLKVSPVGRDVFSLLDEDACARLKKRLALVREGGRVAAPDEISIGGERTVQLYVSHIGESKSGGPPFLLYLIDTTEQKKLEIQFVQSQKMQAIGQLAGGVAHDFNNLLTAMIGFCDLLLLRHPAGDQSFSDIMHIKQNANRAANLVRQLLAFSRQQTLRPKVLVLSDVFAELSNLLRRLIGEKIELKVINGADVGLVKVDQGQLEQVIINLAVNARDAMPGGGMLTIRTDNASFSEEQASGEDSIPPGDYAMIEVSDTGKGIEKEILGKIFDPFFTTKEVGAGTGLGLSTVYGIIKQTGGFIQVDSTPGKGTSFRIYLPLHEVTEGEDLQEEGSRERLMDLTGRGTILLVEDEDPVRLFAARALTNKGYTVFEAASGEEALEVLKNHGGPVDLLISDVVMPNMDGPALVRHVREKWPDLKVVFISGYAQDNFRQDMGLDQENIGFLPKPFSLNQLAGQVKKMLGG